MFRKLRRPIRDVLRHRSELREQLRWSREAWQIEREVETLAVSGRPLVAGPWLSEVGFEALYWIPFLRWVKAAFRLDPARVVAVSRGAPVPGTRGLPRVTSRPGNTSIRTNSRGAPVSVARRSSSRSHSSTSRSSVSPSGYLANA